MLIIYTTINDYDNNNNIIILSNNKQQKIRNLRTTFVKTTTKRIKYVLSVTKI